MSRSHKVSGITRLDGAFAQIKLGFHNLPSSQVTFQLLTVGQKPGPVQFYNTPCELVAEAAIDIRKRQYLLRGYLDYTKVKRPKTRLEDGGLASAKLDRPFVPDPG